jgi:hypothetical protein
MEEEEEAVASLVIRLGFFLGGRVQCLVAQGCFPGGVRVRVRRWMDDG